MNHEEKNYLIQKIENLDFETVDSVIIYFLFNSYFIIVINKVKWIYLKLKL